MDFLDGFWLGLGVLSAWALVGGAGSVIWVALERRRPEPTEVPEVEEEPEPDEDPRPEWMKSRNGKPYDPTAGYEPRRGRRRSSGELTTPPET